MLSVLCQFWVLKSHSELFPGCDECQEEQNDKDQSLFKIMVVDALKNYSDFEDKQLVLLKITKMQEAILSGVKYYIDYEAVPKTCGLGDKFECPVALCFAVIIYRFWLPDNENTYIQCIECQDQNTLCYYIIRGNCLTRFYNLFDSVIEFLETKDTELRNKLITSKNDIAYMTARYKLFNDMNLQPQGDELNLFKTKNVVAAFAAKLLLHKKNMGRREFHNFPNLSITCRNDDMFAYCQHLENLHIDFTERYQDILNLVIPDWVLDPFSNVNTTISPQLEEELIKLTTNEEIKIKFKNGSKNFGYKNQSHNCTLDCGPSFNDYLLIAFPSSYLCERGFSAVTTLLTKKRNRLHVTERGDLRLFLSKLEPNINKLIKQHQIHPSH